MPEPLYDLATRSWTGTCPCIRAEQRDPECEWHGRPLEEVSFEGVDDDIDDQTPGGYDATDGV